MTAGPARAPVTVLRRWLLALPRNAHAPALDIDTDIIESGILDSLEFINFLLLIESLRGSEIAPDDISLDDFRTLRAISDAYLGEARAC